MQHADRTLTAHAYLRRTSRGNVIAASLTRSPPIDRRIRSLSVGSASASARAFCAVLLAVAVTACGGGSSEGSSTGTPQSPSDPPSNSTPDDPSDELPDDQSEDQPGDQSSDGTTLDAPSGVVLVPGHGSATASWNAVANAEGYHLYYAEDPGLSPENYAAQGGTWLQNVSSPRTIDDLTHGATYYFVVTAFAGEAEGPPSQLAAITLPAPISNAATHALNDTGANRCANESQIQLDCPQENYPQQDAEIGRDADASAGRLPKAGSGAAGFDFTKISGDGLVLSADATLGTAASDWTCTLDHVTGLLWEVRPNQPGTLRDRAHTYSWFSSDETTNGGHAGTPEGGTCTNSGCDTSSYVSSINAQTLCGFDDWRLPTADELASLVHHGRTNPAIDLDYFPDVPSADALYWTSTPFAQDASKAWSVNFDNGELVNVQKAYPAYLRLVRASK